MDQRLTCGFHYLPRYSRFTTNIGNHMVRCSTQEIELTNVQESEAGI